MLSWGWKRIRVGATARRNWCVQNPVISAQCLGSALLRRYTDAGVKEVAGWCLGIADSTLIIAVPHLN